ncbi:MAG: mannosyl-3-phosphoglycerate phosphatase [Dehalococcoidia bacterium]|nr:mannosyl-3-phosphoglycerate phosphatase [Dehalococcoidia bacterium]
MKQIVFTDLDGTLLDSVTYSYEKSLIGVKRLKQNSIPIIFCSAKTRAEQESYRHKMKVFHPFIVENGGAIFIPQGYFPFPFMYHKITAGNLLVIELGAPYEEIKELLDNVKREGNFHFKGFGDMSVEEIARETGLDIESAKLAKQREYSETVKLDLSDEEASKALEKIEASGLNWTHGGRFYEIIGDNDKGKAVAIMSDLYRRMWDSIETIGLGDSLNDLPLLSAVDVPILVQKRDYTWENMNLPHLRKVQGIGPEGWSKGIEEIFGG